MKKVFLIVLLICLALFATYDFIATIAATTFNTENQALEASYNELKKDFNELESKYETYKTDVELTRGLAYELLFEMVYHQVILQEDYDLIAELEVIEAQYGLSLKEKMELYDWVEILTEKYSN